jgi:tetratricopeptide (TPR) repeat protein
MRVDRVAEPGGLPAVHCIENHDEAYLLWRERRFRNRVLVHVDAHHDMWWTSDSAVLTIANFICPALREQIARELYWVVPDATWRTKSGRAAVRAHLRTIQREYPEKPFPVQIEQRSIRTTVLGCPLVICSLDSLPEQSDRVLLDIDADFLVIPSVRYRAGDRHSDLPWLWPHELHERLQAKRIEAEYVTVAYSVAGGHTPLQWKYLGDEIALRLQVSESGGQLLEPYDSMREAALAAYRGDHMGATTLFRRLGDAIGAPPYFHLALSASADSDIKAAREWYQRALACDPSYRIICDTTGAHARDRRSMQQIERGAHNALRLDPANASAHVALGWTAIRRKQWRIAENRARAALSHQPELIDAHRLLGRALEGQGCLRDAIQVFERSLTLALAGQRPLNGIITSQVGPGRLLDSHHARTHAHLARLYARSGDHKRAIVAFRMAIAGGVDTTAIRFRLAALYLRWHRWREARQQLYAGLKAMTRWWRTREVSA